mgnify:CR=1 FL=1
MIWHRAFNSSTCRMISPCLIMDLHHPLFSLGMEPLICTTSETVILNGPLDMGIWKGHRALNHNIDRIYQLTFVVYALSSLVCKWLWDLQMNIRVDRWHYTSTTIIIYVYFIICVVGVNQYQNLLKRSNWNCFTKVHSSCALSIRVILNLARPIIIGI